MQVPGADVDEERRRRLHAELPGPRDHRDSPRRALWCASGARPWKSLHV